MNTCGISFFYDIDKYEDLNLKKFQQIHCGNEIKVEKKKFLKQEVKEDKDEKENVEVEEKEEEKENEIEEKEEKEEENDEEDVQNDDNS